MENLSEMNEEFEGSLGIAIIGMAARFPGAKNITEFWENLCAGKETIHTFTTEELLEAGVSQDELNDPNYIKASPILENIDLFDAAFFDYTPMEATFMDPQQRLLLECSWEALEDAGYTGKRTSDSIGVYVGAKMNTYLADFFANPQHFSPIDKMHVLVGNAEFALGTRISYKLNLKGPSYMLQTGCSTSLAAIHLACQALLLDECRMALAGAVAIEIPHQVGYHYQPGGPASPDGHCRPFDAQAQGTVFGSGVGMVVLKRLEDALADGDHIYAVIRGTSVNNDGAVKASFTAPSVEGQTQVLMEALACANVPVESISYIETHGTGTPLGDPIEIMALTNAFRAGTKRRGFCRLGSVKSNVGHLDAVAGMAGLIKTALALKYKKIPASLNFEQSNSEIDFTNSPFVMNTELTAWENIPLPRRAGVSSFGFGGTNTHIILEEAPPVEPSALSPRPWQLLILSGKTNTALDTANINLSNYLRQNPNIDLADVAYTLQVGRPAFKQRRIVVCRDLADAIQVLGAKNNPRLLTAEQETGNRPAAFMFSGQGTQYVNMGLELYQTEPVFRQHIDHCAELLIPHLGFDLRSVLYPSPDEAELATKKLTQTDVTQPALFTIEYALAQLWQTWGITPQAMIGHSIGEYVAACLAGVFSLADGLKLVAARGRLMAQLPPGAMLTVALSEQEIQPFLDSSLSLAGINGPGRCVISGPTEAVEKLANRLTEAGVTHRSLHTSHAFHSQMMEPILEPFMAQFQGIKLNAPQIPYISNVSGTWITAEEATSPRYWANHLRQAVRFAAGVNTLLAEPDRVLLEIGPGRALSTLARGCLKPGEQVVILSSLRHPQDEQSEVEFTLNTLGSLWLAGVTVDWTGFYGGERRQRIPLPTYPFERQRYWFEPLGTETPANNKKTEGSSSTKKLDVANWFYLPSWKRSMLLAANHPEEATPSCWLFFMDECGLGAKLAERVSGSEQTVIRVRAGTEFARLNDAEFTLNPAQRDDYLTLLEALKTMGKYPETIVHLWSVTAEQPETSLERVEQGQNLGFYSLLFLAQALGKEGLVDPLRLVVISNNIQEVTGKEIVSPEKATSLGAVKVIPLEYPNISCRSIDVALNQAQEIESELIDQLQLEITAKTTAPIVAYRGRHRWEQIFEPIRLDMNEVAKPVLRPGGVYLITGGLGDIGLELARHLAETAQAKLILTRRSAFPPAEEWEKWLATHGEEDEVGRKIRKTQEIKLLGGEVLVASADVTNLEQMRAIVAAANERFGPINGVFHAAGIGVQRLDKVMSLIPEANQTQCNWHFSPKIYGSLVIEDLFQTQELDFCVLLSSLASILGGLGFAAYAAANSFMDALVHRANRHNSTPWISINWDTWQLDEQPAQEILHGSAAAEFGITGPEGMEAFRRILTADLEGQVIVSTGDLQARIRQWVKPERPVNGKGKLGLSSFYPRPNLRNVYAAPSNALERKLVGIWQEVLGVEPVGINDNFFELGGDSLIGLKLISQLKEEFSIEIPAVDLYKGPTVSRLATLIDQKIGQVQEDDSAYEMGQNRGARRLERRQQRKR